MTSAIEGLAALYVGTVESVAPDSIGVVLDAEAPQTTALNTGVPSTFPRLNGYVLIPKEAGALVGLVVWLGIERSPLPRQTGERGRVPVIDLPYPSRRMTVAPVGTLGAEPSGDSFRMERGVAVFPSVGDQVLLPTREQLRAIVEPTGTDQRVTLGSAVLAARARVAVDPDKLFGRHLAVLGNTGSGKSCTVAGIVRWSLEAAAKRRGKGERPNARFIVLDPNGEYGTAFDGIPGAIRRFQVPPVEGDGAPLLVPAWLWNSQEWSAFAAASPRVQRPILMRALRDLRSAALAGDPTQARLWQRLKLLRDWLKLTQGKGPSAQEAAPARKFIGDYLVRATDDLRKAAGSLGDPIKSACQSVAGALETLTKLRGKAGKDGTVWYDPFGTADFDAVVATLDAALQVVPPPPSLGVESEDAPIPFEVRDLADRLEVLAQDDGVPQAAQFISSLILRVRTMLADRRMKPIIAPEKVPTFEEWLETYIGADAAANGTVAVIDLSLVPSDVVHVVVAVLGRVVFEATQRYRRQTGAELPTVLVLEEAHTFVQRFDREDGDTLSPAQACRQTFERIAREGRKFGLGLVLSSQRPSELSPTVLAQCNSFILHRLVNDRDQDLVSRLVPDNIAGLLRELPTLPTRHAILLGWAAPLPVLMEVAELPAAHRPASSDPKFWETWTGEVQRKIDWAATAAEWAGTGDADVSVEHAAVAAMNEAHEAPAAPKPARTEKRGR